MIEDKYCFSLDEESFDGPFDTIEEALEEGRVVADGGGTKAKLIVDVLKDTLKFMKKKAKIKGEK